MKIRMIGVTAVTAVTAVMALTLAACGGSDDGAASEADASPSVADATPSVADATPSEADPTPSKADATASKAIANSIMDSNDSTFEVTQDQADCVGEGMVEDIGTDQLVEYGSITEDNEASDGLESVKMSEGDAHSAADVMQDCADIKEIFTGAMGDLHEEAQTCIDEKLTNDILNEFLVSVFMDDQDAGNEGLMGALTECMSAGG